jgi:hypothetical protein
VIGRTQAGAFALGLLALLLMGCGVTGVQTVEGLVVEVVSDSLVDIEEFTLRTDQGERLRFSLGDVDFGHGGFPTTHLREHQALAQPVRVTYRLEGEINVVVRLEDAE